MNSLASISSLSYFNNGCCTLKRMLVVIAVFMGLSILMLLLQYYFTRGGSLIYSSIPIKGAMRIKSSDPNASSSIEHCWALEDHVLLAECVPCSDFEKAANIKPCHITGYYDKINCSNTGIVYRSCDRVHWLEERNFIAFIIVSSICAALFSLLAYWRQKVLDGAMIEKLQKQLGSGM